MASCPGLEQSAGCFVNGDGHRVRFFRALSKCADNDDFRCGFVFFSWTRAKHKSPRPKIRTESIISTLNKKRLPLDAFIHNHFHGLFIPGVLEINKM